jgi:SAM-dependent methyltransferase
MQGWKQEMQDRPSFDDLIKLFDKYGGTPEVYLSQHYQRFITTLDEFCSTWTERGRNRVLDIGAHWLHQSIIWRQAGFELTAVDLPGTFEEQNVIDIAADFGVRLLKCPNLELARELEALPDDSVDVILFTEIIEHITFNPVALWRQLYRVLAPGGRIVVTTPNYYSAKGRAWRPLRFIAGMGGGISVDEVLAVHTYGHHWREYSRREMLRYFKLLSPDFVVVKARAMPTYALSAVWWKRMLQRVLDRIPPLRPNLHVEIALPTKDQGIVARPHW